MPSGFAISSVFPTIRVRPTQAASVSPNRFRCVREVAEGGQRFLELDTGEGWAFDKANFFETPKPLFICHGMGFTAPTLCFNKGTSNFSTYTDQWQYSTVVWTCPCCLIAVSLSIHFESEMSTYHLPHPTPCRPLGRLELSASASVNNPFTRPKLPKRSRWELHGCMAPSCCSGLKPCDFCDLHVLFVSLCVYIYIHRKCVYIY